MLDYEVRTLDACLMAERSSPSRLSAMKLARPCYLSLLYDATDQFGVIHHGRCKFFIRDCFWVVL